MILRQRLSVLAYIILSNALLLSGASGLPSHNHGQTPALQAGSPLPEAAVLALPSFNQEQSSTPKADCDKIPNIGFSVTHMNISLKTDFQTNNIETVVEAAIENTSHNPIESAEFWLCSGGTNDPDLNAELKHVYLLGSDTEQDLDHAIRKITDKWKSRRVALPDPLTPGGKLTLRFEYTMIGKPDHSSSPIMSSKEGFKEAYLRGGDYLWCPEPYYDLDSQHVSRNAIRPTWNMRIEYPAGYLAITNGELLRRVEKNGLVTDQWKFIPLLSGTPYLYIGPYKVLERTIGDLTFEMYAPDRQILEHAAEKLDTYARIFTYYTELFGPPIQPTYRIIGSSLDNVGNSFTTGQFVNMNRLDDIKLITHEMSHIWWGGIAPPTGPGWKFLSEAMAEFSEEWILSLLGEENDERLTASNILANKQNYVCPYIALGHAKKRRMGTGPLLFHEGCKPYGITNANYNWGPVVVNQIRSILGNDTFFECLRTYLDNYRGGRPTIEDFIRTINTVSGMDLTSEFEGLLTTTGFPSYHILSFESQPAKKGFRTEVRIENTGDYALTCPLMLKTLTGPGRETFKVQPNRKKDFTFHTTHRVIDVIIDPDSTTLQYHPEQKLRLFEAVKCVGNWEYYGKAYMYYALGEYEHAVDTISDYLHRSMRRHSTDNIDELLSKSGMAPGYVFMRGVFALGLDDTNLAERDIKRTFPYMLRQMLGADSVRAPDMYYYLGAITRENLAEYLDLLSTIAGRKFSFEAGLDEPARMRKVEKWRQWWDQKGKNRKLDLTAIKKRTEALKKAFCERELSHFPAAAPNQ